MYNILLINHLEEKQSEIARIAYKDRAFEQCELEALKFVVAKEGEKYIEKGTLFCERKSDLPKGYGIVKKNKGYMLVCTVYKRVIGGYIIGKSSTDKIMTYFTFRTKTPVVERYSVMDASAKSLFDHVLKFLPENPLMNLMPILEDCDDVE